MYCMRVCFGIFGVSIIIFTFWGAEGAPILFSDLGLRMASYSYIYILADRPAL